MFNQRKKHHWGLPLVRAQQLQIIDQIPDIEVDLDWDHDMGVYDDTISIEAAGFVIEAQIKVNGTVTHVYAGDYQMQEEKDVKINPPEVGQVIIFDTEGNEISITDKQYTSLAYHIKQNIRTND